VSPSLAIHHFEASRPDAAAVDAFVAEHRFPLVEGTSCTFVWRGEAEEVRHQHWVFGLPSSEPFRRIEGTDLWYHVIEVPPSSRVEYKFIVDRNGSRELIRDPFNDKLAHDPYGANSVLQTPGYEEPEWVHPDPEARAGELRDIQVPSVAFGHDRPVTLYLPARFRSTRAYPLLVAHDGGDYLKYSALRTVLDNLIHRLEIPPMVVALTHPGDRLVEYAADPRHGRFLVEELVPHLENTLPLEGTPASRGILGASFGGVAAFAAARHAPGFFGRLLLQSGSFAFTDIGENRRGPAFDPVVDFVNSWRDDPVPVAEKLFVSCGIYESLIYENRSLVPLLQASGMEVRYVEARDGHNWENWRDRLREGLSWLFPGPLWMVYE
jgi:enterochelin esterase family protein